MADVFDEIYGASQGAPAAPGGDVFAEVYGQPQVQPQQGGVMNELLSAVGSGARTAGAMLDLVEAAERNLNFRRAGGPRLFGLNENILNRPPEKPLGATLAAKVFPEAKAQTDVGKFLENASEGAVGAAPFGPQAMVAGALLTGTGGLLGEKVGAEFGSPEAGRIGGQILANLTPAAFTKIGLIDEARRLLGPLFSQSATETGVGRVLREAVKSPDEAAAALRGMTKTAADDFKTVGERLKDPGLIAVEDAVASSAAGGRSGLKELPIERAATREQAISKGLAPSEDLYSLSKGAEEQLAKAGQAVRQVEDAFWQSIDMKVPVVTKSEEVATSWAQKLNELTLEGTDELKGRAGALLSLFQKRVFSGDTASLETLQKMRSTALKEMRKAGDDRALADAASAVEQQIREIIDLNATNGSLPEDIAQAWTGARTFTAAKFQTFGARKTGTQNQGTKITEAVALKGAEPLDAAVIQEGLRSPDALRAQLQAAEAGGQDLRPIYKKALQRELAGTSQARWADVLSQKRQQFESVFSVDEMREIDRIVQDVADQVEKGRILQSGVTGNSLTFGRGDVNRAIQQGKGVAGGILSTPGLSVAPAIAGAGIGGNIGWQSGEGPIDSAARALVGASVGAALGKGLTSRAEATSTLFDELLSQAIKDPQEAARLIEKAKPSEAGRILREALGGAAKATVAKEAGRAISNQIGAKPTDLGTLGPRPELDREPEPAPEPTAAPASPQELKQDVSAIESEIDADPFFKSVYEIESGRNPKAKNPESSAAGAFQLISATAESLGVEDVYDLRQNFEGFKNLTEEHRALFGDDPFVLYAAHYLGSPTVRKLLRGEELTGEQKRLYSEFMRGPAQRFQKIYRRNAGIDEV